ncbi:TetR/AcrR family transcriptional regulator [Allokutzneria oryzae]|uniref:TetR/AcrR family transcriptional regulator n=1 Tax=Allokutzneria oryzae TaxID=1378989 RepID=A0ABV6A595_9PSEU
MPSTSARQPLELLVGAPPKERTDAARNRVRILEAAAELFRASGVDAVSMDAVAERAGVGKGTLFRRFGDKAGLAYALLDELERGIQQDILGGEPPLGPGAPARERLTAFMDVYLGHVLRNLDLVRLSETASPGARYRVGAYRFWHRHLVILIEEAGVSSDADYLAHAVLASLAADHVGVLVDELGEQRARAGARDLVERLVPSAGESA